MATTSAPKEVVQLVERFERHFDAYHAPGYNEETLRNDFLNPFFEALGWDVANRQGFDHTNRQVVLEQSIEVAGRKRAPDYCFQIGGTKKFYVEAKKPSVDIGADPGPAHQLRRYAWTSHLAISVLSDFEEFSIYDCSKRPSPSDRASVARLDLIPFRDYPARWPELVDLLSPDAIQRGSFDRFLGATGVRRGTATVDDEFLRDMEHWRAELARVIALRNPKLDKYDLRKAVQLTLDRIIFLRICEDRGIENLGSLNDLLRDEDIYPRLFKLFKAADERYNSGLFHFRAEKGREDSDSVTPGIKLDDKVLKDIISSLYPPTSPYAFSVMPADILGQVYERFLGKVIRLTEGHQAKVEEKPEVRKAGGVYYTPTYIVDYIVKNTVGKLLEGSASLTPKPRPLTPSEASRLRILDPACGSGSFLLGAYQYLLNWYLSAYIKDGPQKHKDELYQTRTGEWRLTTAARKSILLNNIYGVDIDSQAVEVTKLSLLLKVLEGETAETVNAQTTMFHTRALPDLDRNIKCGNSLIGTDFYHGEQGSLFDDPEQKHRVNAFDWETEFPAIMKAGGFDAVIGNPPYILIQDELRDDDQLAYLRRRYSAASYKVDTYHIFIERATLLLKAGGLGSMITPANYLTNNHLAGLRRFVLQNTRIRGIVVINGGVFEGVSVDNAIFVVERGVSREATFPVMHSTTSGSSLIPGAVVSVSSSRALADPLVLFTGASDRSTSKLWGKVASASRNLGLLADVNFGKQLRDRKEFTRDVIDVRTRAAIPPRYRPCYTGRDVTRYHLGWGKLACLDDESARRGGCWDKRAQNARMKLLTRQIGKYPEFSIDEDGFQCLNTVFMVNVHSPGPSPLYVLGLLNSSLIRHYWVDRFWDKRKTFPKIKGTYLKQLPVRDLNLSDELDKALHDKMVSLVERMLKLHKDLPKAKTAQEKTAIERQIAATDRQIDELVYELYGLTKEEVRIVEGGA